MYIFVSENDKYYFYKAISFSSLVFIFLILYFFSFTSSFPRRTTYEISFLFAYCKALPTPCTSNHCSTIFQVFLRVWAI